MKDFQGRSGPVSGLTSLFISIRKISPFTIFPLPTNESFSVIKFYPFKKYRKYIIDTERFTDKYGAGGIRQPYVRLLIFQNFAGEERQKQYRTKNSRKMEEGKNEIMELRQMIEGCFERQNKLIARLEMELEALSSFNGKQMLDSRDMRLQLKVCDRTLIRWRMSGKLPSFKISGKVYFWAFDVYKFLREEYGTAALPEAFEEQEPITIKNSKTNGKSK